MTHQVPSSFQKPRLQFRAVDFDVGDPELIEQTSFEIEEITLSGEHQVTIETEWVSDITVTGEHAAVSK